MGLFDDLTEGLGEIFRGVVPLATAALGARVTQKLGPRNLPQSAGVPQFQFPQVARQQPSATVFGGFPVPGAHQMNPFGSGPFLPAAVQQASFLPALPAIGGAILRQLPGALGGAVAVEGAQALFGGGGAVRMPGGIAVNQLFRMTKTGRLSPERIAFMEDGQGRGSFFINAGVPTAFSKATIKKRHTHKSHHPR